VDLPGGDPPGRMQELSTSKHRNEKYIIKDELIPWMHTLQ
jgi:hypothetical protein